MVQSAQIVAFPARAQARSASAPDVATVRALRRCARRSHVAGRLDLEALCASNQGDHELWGAALLQATARARRDVVLHRVGGASASECWLAQLIAALRAGDDDSARFIVERHLDQKERRLALCFAQRMARGPECAQSA